MRSLSSRKRIIIGLAAAALAVVSVIVYTAEVRADAYGAREAALEKYGGEQAEVCVATRDILPGETIAASDVTALSWPTSLLVEGCVTDAETIVGTQTSSLILAGEPITTIRLDAGTPMLDVPDGLVAVSVPAKDVRAVGGALGRGALVNVYVQGSGSVSLIGENLLVLATSKDLAQTNSSSTVSLSWITLAVTPESVQELLTAAQEENLYFTLPGNNGGGNDE